MNKSGILGVIAFTVVFLILQVAIVVPQKRAHDKWVAEIEKFKHDHPEVAHVPNKLVPKVWKEIQAKKANGVAPEDSSRPSGVAPTNTAVPAALSPRRAEFEKQLADSPDRVKVELDAPNFVARLATQGGSLETLTFKNVKESSFLPVTKEGDKRMSELAAYEPLHPYGEKTDPLILTLALTSAQEDGLERMRWLDREVEVVLADGTTKVKGLRFERVLGKEGELLVSKTFYPTASASDYHLGFRVSVENRGSKALPFGYKLLGPAGIVEPASSRPQGIQVELYTRDGQNYVSGKKADGLSLVKGMQEKEKKKLTASANATNNTRIAFFGVSAKYFASVVIPLDGDHPPATLETRTILDLAGRQATPEEMKRAEAFEDSIAREATVEAFVPDLQVPPGETISQEYALYTGPKSDTIFSENRIYEQAGLRELSKYGSMFPGADLLAWALTHVLHFFHWITGSWGVSILLLTAFVRGALHPLMVRQTKTSLKMQALSPETQKLKEKYADKDGNLSPENQKKFGEEQMELWRKHGLGPMHFLGCMGPIFLQMPVFIGLWAALSYAFELRQASFLWIRDLSEPDVVARLPLTGISIFGWQPFTLPFQATNALCILPFCMLLVYIVQMRSMPKPVDPQQAEQQKIFNWMMPIMGYMFYKFPSGLLLYYITSASWGLIEQRWIKRRLAAAGGGSSKLVPVKV